jgi:GMP synthase-like glutamine amidotransferase
MRIGLLQADWVNAEFIAKHGDLPDMFAAYLGADAVRIDVFEAYKNQFPDRSYRCDVFAITGSRFSANGDEDWIATLRDFIRSADQGPAKVIGFCFGHQIIAQALGGRVMRLPSGWNVGVRKLHISKPAPWMEPFRPALDLIFNHSEQVVELPRSAQLLAGDRHCPAQMFSLGRTYLGIQAHPEYTTAYQEDLMSVAAGLSQEKRSDAVGRNRRARFEEAVTRSWIRKFVGVTPDRMTDQLHYEAQQ